MINNILNFSVKLFLVLTISAFSNIEAQEKVSTVQDSQFFAFAKANDSNVSEHLNKIDPNNNYRYQVIQSVLDKLIMAKGDKSMPAPTLVVGEDQKYVAFINFRTIEIGLEQRAYDICTTMGKDSLNALAVLLGHEITHYYEKHKWTDYFTRRNSDVHTARKLKLSLKNEALRNEAQADYLGGFLGYSAGFNTLGIMPQLIRELYKGYGLQERIPGYPSLSDRVKVSEESMDLLEELIYIFDMANYLTAVKDYSNARKHYKRILNDFQSREIYNNMGVVLFLEAMELFGPNEVMIGYPIELDVESRLSLGSRGDMGFVQRKNKREKLLKEAIDNFEHAISLDKEYTIGYLNMACAYSLLGNTDEANYFANVKAKKYAWQQNSKVTQANVLVIQGIIAHQMGNDEEAKSLFAEAAGMNNTLATTNLKVLNGEESKEYSSNTIDFSIKPERIDNMVLRSFLDNPTYNSESGDKIIEVENGYHLYVIKNTNSRIYLAYNEDESYSCIQITNKDYPDTTTNHAITIGDPLDKVTNSNKFGEANFMLPTSLGLYLVYDKKNLMFIFDEDNKLVQWAAYDIYLPN